MPAYRTVRTLPVVFSGVDQRTLFFGNNYLWKTVDGGVTWTHLGDDPTRKTYELPATIGKYTEPALAVQRGVIYTIAPSYLDINRIWIGTDDGIIKTTTDGGATWKEVTPPALKPWMKVFNMDAGRFDAQTAYAAVNTLRLDDMRPHLWRTHDGGATWTEINTGLDDGGPTSSIREDPKRKGLLYAATERRVYVSFDDGDHWQSLQLNMAASSVRDIIVKDDDLIAATHGRGFWILDNVTPLRQIDQTTTDADALLFRPQAAYRVRWNTNTDTPLPPDEPTAPNPPEGAIVDYYLKAAAAGPVTLEITDAEGRLVRQYSSTDPIVRPDAVNGNLPLYWFRPPVVLSTTSGMHRFTWDVHYQPLAGGGGGRGGLPIAAVPYNTVPAPTVPWVSPGTYTVKLTVNGKSYTQPITVKQDPRVKTPAIVMQRVYSLTRSAYMSAVDTQKATAEARNLHDEIARIKGQATGSAAAALAEFDKKVEAAFAPGGSALTAVMNTLQSADAQPTALQVKTMESAVTNARAAIARWSALKTTGLAALNVQLKTAGISAIGQAR
jgi:HPt (histidine-containing phosphotransfer) domain-containing protein